MAKPKKNSRKPKKAGHRKSAAAVKRGHKAWRSFCKKHGGVKKAKALRAKQLARGRKKAKKAKR